MARKSVRIHDNLSNSIGSSLLKLLDTDCAINLNLCETLGRAQGPYTIQAFAILTHGYGNAANNGLPVRHLPPFVTSDLHLAYSAAEGGAHGGMVFTADGSGILNTKLPYFHKTNGLNGVDQSAPGPAPHHQWPAVAPPRHPGLGPPLSSSPTRLIACGTAAPSNMPGWAVNGSGCGAGGIGIEL